MPPLYGSVSFEDLQTSGGKGPAALLREVYAVISHGDQSPALAKRVPSCLARLPAALGKRVFHELLARRPPKNFCMVCLPVSVLDKKFGRH